jgi:hypothetical protein
LSLAFISPRSFPWPRRAKPWLILTVILAGCGGGGNANWQQVQGDGFRFNAPAGWRVEGSSASSGAVNRVQVSRFRLQRPYNPARRAAVAGELDRAATSIAAQQKGAVKRRSALEVAGLDARTYSIDYDGKTEEITFVLDGQNEYQLLCRRPSGGSDDACGELVRSFRLGLGG